MPIDEFREDVSGEAGIDGLDESGLESFSTGAAKRRVGSGAIVMGLLIAGSVGGLYSMRTLGTSSATTGVDASLESTIDEGLKQLGTNEPVDLGKASDLMPDFSGKQVPADSLALNPFQSIADPTPEPIEVLDTETGPTADEIARAIRVAGESAFSVSSIVAGRQTAAIVNGEIVRPGDILEAMTPYGTVTFELAEIVREAVRLRAEHAELEAPVVITLTVLEGG